MRCPVCCGHMGRFSFFRSLLKVPGTEFRKSWDRILLRHTTVKLREHGLNRADAKRGARQAIEAMRTISRLRV